MAQRFFLHGVLGLYNYGCEAIIRGTVLILKKQFPDCEIFYLSKQPDKDKRFISDISVTIINNRVLQKNVLLTIIIEKILIFLNIESLSIVLEKFHDYKRGDIILSIGGDLFTLPPEPYPKKMMDKRIALYKFAKKRGAKVILWGASIGPFDRSLTIYKYYLSNFNIFDSFTIREDLSKKYLEDKMGIKKNIFRVSDPAFLMQIDKKKKHNSRNLIGINLSTLSIKYLQAEKNKIKYIIGKLINDFNTLLKAHKEIDLVFIPHVWSDNPSDNDYFLLKQLNEGIAPIHPSRTTIIDEEIGAIETKKIISRCNFLISARMHCAIAGISMAIPTLLLSYSEKSIGIAMDVFSNTKNIMSINDFLEGDIVSIIEEKFLSEKSEKKIDGSINYMKLEKSAFFASNALLCIGER